MTVKYHQLALKDIFSDCQDMFMDDTLSVFYNAFYQRLGKKRDYPLIGFLSALILQKVFSIPTDSLLILLLSLALASMLTFDTSGIELYVTENNPKTLNSLIRRLKA